MPELMWKVYTSFPKKQAVPKNEELWDYHAMDKEAARKSVGALVEKFRQAEESGAFKRYTEADTKKNFIEPLFSALGWPIDTDEVRMEETISGDRVDYGFYIDGRIQFYLEAKPIKADMNEPKFANQAIKYSWNKGVDWAVLTNFEELKIFNAQDVKASLASKRFKTIRWDEYLDRFDELWLLSKSAWQEKLLDAEAEKSGKKLERVSVTSKLYQDLNEARAALSQAFLTWNPKLRSDPVLLDEGVQKVLDRIIFIRVAEDRGVEPLTLLPLVREWRANWYDRQKRDKYLYQSMEEKFREFDDTYNSNIFAAHPSDQCIDEQNSLQDVIENFYGKHDYYEYDFKAIPADILGTVYEQYLGHRLAKAAKGDLFGTSDIKMAKDARKRKEQGIYYTPRFIVDYIVENALGPVLDNCKTITDLQKIKVLDPACGSGSFLIKALELIYKKYEKFGSKGQYVKLQIIMQNLYGVDLDEQAVEIARLNLLIASLEERLKLPTLKNIRTGNSLISGTDEDLKERFGKNWRDKKPFNWQKEFPEVFAQGGFDVIIGNPPYIKEDTNKSAFDGLHESPYYQGKMDIWTMFASVAIDLLKDKGVLSFIAPNNWVTNAGASNFRNKILNDGELEKFIDFGDDKVFDAAGIQTMVFVFEKGVPEKKYSLEYIRVSDKNISAERLLSVMRGQKVRVEVEPDKLLGKLISFNDESDSRVLEKIASKSNYSLNEKDIGNGIDVLQDFVAQSHLAKLADGSLLKGMGILVLSDHEIEKIKPLKFETKYLRPYYSTEQINRYLSIRNTDKKIIYADLYFREHIEKFPNLKAHLDKFRKILTSAYAPYGLHRARDERFFEGEGIFTIRKTKKPAFTYVNFPCYVTRAFMIIKPADINLKFLTGILNSSTVSFWLRNKGKLQGDQLQIDKDPLLSIPIYVGNKGQQKRIVELVNEMLDLNKKLAEETKDSEKWKKIRTEIERIDKEIDEEVYKLYGLTSEEIKVVEKN